MRQFVLLFTAMVVLAIPSALRAQSTGPGGIGSDDDGELLLWLRADSGTETSSGDTATSDGDTVETWRDRSGNGRDATAITGSTDRRPVLHTDTNGIHGKPVLRFDGSNDYVRTDAEDSSLAQPFTVFAVARRNDGGTTAETILDSRGGGSNEITLGYWSGTQARINAGSNVTLDVTQSDAAILRGIFDGTSSSLALNSDTVVTGDAGTRTADGFRVGASRSTSQLLGGDVAEVIVYNRVLDPAEIALVENYLSTRYDLPIGNDLYTDSLTTHSLIGIARIGDSSHLVSRGDGLMLVDSGFVAQNGDALTAAHDGSDNDVIRLVDNPTGVLARWRREWRLEKRAVGDSSGYVRIGFDFSESGLDRVPRSNCNCQLLYRSSTSDDDVALSASPTVSGDSVFFTLAETSLDDGYYTLGTSDLNDVHLPVELSAFDGRYLEGAVELTWATASELRSGGFILSRADGDTSAFVPIASYISDPSLRGQGTRSTGATYRWIDPDALTPGHTYRYRLQDVDVDGVPSPSSHETTVAIPVAKRETIVRSSWLGPSRPNPARGNAVVPYRLKDDGPVSLDIYTPLGRRVLHHEELGRRGDNETLLDVSGLRAGIYYVRLHSGSYVATRTLEVR